MGFFFILPQIKLKHFVALFLNVHDELHVDVISHDVVNDLARLVVLCFIVLDYSPCLILFSRLSFSASPEGNTRILTLSQPFHWPVSHVCLANGYHWSISI